MVNVSINGRRLGITFDYSHKSAKDIPDPDRKRRLKFHLNGLHGESRDRAKAEFLKSQPKYVRVERPLTQVYLTEGAGKDQIILAKFEYRLSHLDKPFQRGSAELEQFRLRMIRELFKTPASRQHLTRDDRRILWHAILTRFAKRPSVIKVHENSPSGAPAHPTHVVGRHAHVKVVPASESTPPTEGDPLESDAPRVDPSTPDTIPVGHRLEVVPKPVGASEVKPIKRHWHYPGYPTTATGEPLH